MQNKLDIKGESYKIKKSLAHKSQDATLDATEQFEVSEWTGLTR